MGATYRTQGPTLHLWPAGLEEIRTRELHGSRSVAIETGYATTSAALTLGVNPMPTRAIRPLTPRQQDAVNAIESFTCTHHYAPTFADLAAVLGISTTAVEALVEGARKKGRVASAPGVPRSLHVVRPDAAAG